MDCERRVAGSYDAAMGSCPQLQAGIPQACVQASDPGGSWKDASVKEPLWCYTLIDHCHRHGATGVTLAEAVAEDAAKAAARAAARAKLSRAPNDKPICFRYNNKAGCKKKDI